MIRHFRPPLLYLSSLVIILLRLFSADSFIMIHASLPYGYHTNLDIRIITFAFVREEGLFGLKQTLRTNASLAA
jgi:hypothetical protein